MSCAVLTSQETRDEKELPRAHARAVGKHRRCSQRSGRSIYSRAGRAAQQIVRRSTDTRRVAWSFRLTIGTAANACKFAHPRTAHRLCLCLRTPFFSERLHAHGALARPIAVGAARRNLCVRPLESPLSGELAGQVSRREKGLSLWRRPLFEVLVLNRLPRADPLGGIVCEHRVQQRERLRGKSLGREDGGQLVEVARGQHDARGERQRSELWPDALVGSAEQVAHHLQLLDLVRSRHQRPVQQQLAEDAAHRPHVDGEAVAFGAEQELWRAVPQRDHAAGVSALRWLNRARQAKIAQLDGAVRREQQVGKLEVAVEHRVGVQMCDGTEQLLQEALDLRRREGRRHRVEQARQVVLAELEDEEERVELGADYHVEEGDDVRVAEAAQQAHLAQRRERHTLTLAVEAIRGELDPL
mmetsp:Transcript_44586/g.104155  ORF Transcript_44586/g.104155 Transcript_44586/m.104155 type:complete len:414 (+) Transcript_44586:116-1357(+)